MIRGADPRLRLHLENNIAEVGASFACVLERSPQDGVTNDKTLGQIRAVRVGLRCYTEGRGDTDSSLHSVVEVAVDEHGMASAQLELAVPVDGPISYDGSLIRVLWEIEARTDRKLAIDHHATAPILVIPRHGSGRYQNAHPL